MQLQARNADAQLDFILSSLAFVAVSSKMALLHKTGEGNKAIQEGYSLEKSGILEVENYIDKTLYSQSSGRTDLIINTAKKRVYKIIDRQIHALQYELRPFNIRVKIVELGAVITDFYDRSMTHTKQEGLTDYNEYVKNIRAVNDKFVSQGNKPIKTTKVI